MKRKPKITMRATAAILADPLATEAEVQSLKQKMPVAALQHPNCPTVLWWDLAAQHPVEAMHSVLYPLMTLEEPGRWLQIKNSNIAAWIDRYRHELQPSKRYLFSAECAERVLPLFEKMYPTDQRPRIAITIARRFARGQATQEQVWDAYSLAEAASKSAQVADKGVSDAKAAAWKAAASAAEVCHATWLTAGDSATHAARAIFRSLQPFDVAYAAELAERQWQWERLLKYIQGERETQPSLVGAVDNPNVAPFHPTLPGMQPSGEALCILIDLSPVLRKRYLPLFKLEQLADPSLEEDEKGDVFGRVNAAAHVLSPKAQRRFSILFAEHVLPLFRQYMGGTDNRPAKAIEAAKADLLGSISATDLAQARTASFAADKAANFIGDRGQAAILAAWCAAECANYNEQRAYQETVRRAQSARASEWQADKKKSGAMVEARWQWKQVLAYLEGDEAVGGVTSQGRVGALLPFDLTDKEKQPTQGQMLTLYLLSPALVQPYGALWQLMLLEDPELGRKSQQIYDPTILLEAGVALLPDTARLRFAITCARSVLPILQDVAPNEVPTAEKALRLATEVAEGRRPQTDLAVEFTRMTPWLTKRQDGDKNPLIARLTSLYDRARYKAAANVWDAIRCALGDYLIMANWIAYPAAHAVSLMKMATLSKEPNTTKEMQALDEMEPATFPPFLKMLAEEIRRTQVSVSHAVGGAPRVGAAVQSVGAVLPFELEDQERNPTPQQLLLFRHLAPDAAAPFEGLYDMYLLEQPDLDESLPVGAEREIMQARDLFSPESNRRLAVAFAGRVLPILVKWGSHLPSWVGMSKPEAARWLTLATRVAQGEIEESALRPPRDALTASLLQMEKIRSHTDPDTQERYIFDALVAAVEAVSNVLQRDAKDAMVDASFEGVNTAGTAAMAGLSKNSSDSAKVSALNRGVAAEYQWQVEQIRAEIRRMQRQATGAAKVGARPRKVASRR